MRKLALITGASSGIGAAFAELYAEKGYDLFLTARREARLTKMANTLSEIHQIEVHTLPLDLTSPSAPTRLMARLRERGRHVDVLVNNAGFTLPGGFLERGWEDHNDFMHVMLTVPAELCHLILPGMVERGYGRVINVASLVSFTPGSNRHTLYAPIKAALMRLSESLHEETRGTGVHVTALCPGLTRSEFHDANHMMEEIRDVPGFMWQTSQAVAEAGFDAVEANRAVIVPGGVNKLIAALMQVLPGTITRALMREQARHFRGNRERPERT